MRRRSFLQAAALLPVVLPFSARVLSAAPAAEAVMPALIEVSGQYPANKRVKAKADRPALADIKTFREEPAVVEKQADQIKAQYARYFKV